MQLIKMSELEAKLFDKAWNQANREDIINQLKENDFDIIVIGGGITGAGVAREAAMRGLKVALLDKQDFAAGTSSRSSKLAHGGIRYLAHGEMKLVKEATTERNWQRIHIPHLVRPIPFLFINWEGGKDKKRTIKAGVKLYDFLSDKGQTFKNYKKHSWHTTEEILKMEPEIRKEGNLGGAVYYDNNIDDARLTIETIKEAIIRGALAVNYCEARDYVKENGKIIGVKCKDLENDNELNIKGKLVVNATGIWTDELVKNYPEDVPKPVIKPTKGVHLQYRKKHAKNEMATIIRSITDDRAFFVLPRGNYTIIGTTDTFYDGDLANPFCNKEDADYLITSVKHYFPTAELDYDNLLSTYAGIRPLVREKGKSESDVSRKHLIFWSEDGLVSICGGKLTTWRRMAADLMREIHNAGILGDIKQKKKWSRQKFMIGLEEDAWKEIINSSEVKLDDDVAHHVYQQYGKGAKIILDLIKEDPSLKERIITENEFIKAEVVYGLRYELTPHLIDVFCRRTEMSLFIDHRNAEEAAKKVADLMANEYGWGQEQKTKEIQEYLQYVKKTVSFI